MKNLQVSLCKSSFWVLGCGKSCQFCMWGCSVEDRKKIWFDSEVIILQKMLLHRPYSLCEFLQLFTVGLCHDYRRILCCCLLRCICLEYKVSCSWGPPVPHRIFQRKAVEAQVFPVSLRLSTGCAWSYWKWSLIAVCSFSPVTAHFSIYVSRCQSLMTELQLVKKLMIKMNCILQQSVSCGL